MHKIINLEILTPYGKYFTGNVEEIQVHSDDFFLGITPNHSSLISSVIVSKMTLRIDGKNEIYAIGGGIINVKDGNVKLLLNSVEHKSEIDLDRAIEAKKRAEERLASSDNIDIARAQLSLKRALNRIEVYHL